MFELNEAKKTKNWEDTSDLIRRRLWWFLLPLFFGWVLTSALAWVLPIRYRSEAIILSSQPTVPEKYVTQNIQIDMAERMQNVTQEILSRNQLQRIIDEYNLYPGLRDQAASSKQVDKIRKDINVNPIPVDDLAQSASTEDPATAAKRALSGQGGKVPDTVAFKVSYVAPAPRLAQSVTKSLVELFIQESVQQRQEKSETTTGFLSQQVAAAQKKLQTQAERIQAFKTQYLGELPEQVANNVQFMTILQSRLQAANDALSKAEQQQLYLKSQQGQYQTLGEGLVHEDSSIANSLTAVNMEIANLKTELARLNVAHEENYPDVRRLNGQIARDEKQEAQLEAQLATGKEKPGAAQPFTPRPTSLSELKEVSPFLQVESQIKANQREIDDRRAEVKSLDARIEEYQKRINKAPLLEVSLAEFTRDYDRSKAAYEQLAAKESESELATNLERQHQGGRFTVLSYPGLPKQPAFPNRSLFSLIGLAVGTVLGFVLAGIAELRDDRIHSERELKGIVPASVLTSIPRITTSEEESTHRAQLEAEYATAVLMAVVMLAGTLFAFMY